MTETNNVPIWEQYPAFYNNPLIRSLGHEYKWTVSDNRKRPIDIRALKSSGEVYGAKTIDRSTLMNLGELVTFLPEAANHAFFLEASVDKCMVVDIEPSCPPAMVEYLLNLPWLYAERSMSGKGYHLLMPLPANYLDFPIAVNKVKLQAETKHYEILMHHWVTFTRQPVEGIQPGRVSWENFYASLAQHARDQSPEQIDISEDKPSIPDEDMVIDYLVQHPYTKTLDDFHGNNSAYEFGMMGHYYNQLDRAMMARLFGLNTYDANQRAWIIYDLMCRLVKTGDLEYRMKYDEFRSGMPWFLYCAQDLVSRRMAEKQGNLR